MPQKPNPYAPPPQTIEVNSLYIYEFVSSSNLIEVESQNNYHFVMAYFMYRYAFTVSPYCTILYHIILHCMLKWFEYDLL